MVSPKMVRIKFFIVIFFSNNSLAPSEGPETPKIFLFLKNFFPFK